MKVNGFMSLGVAIGQFDIIWNSNLGGKKITNCFTSNKTDLNS